MHTHVPVFSLLSACLTGQIILQAISSATLLSQTLSYAILQFTFFQMPTVF